MHVFGTKDRKDQGCEAAALTIAPPSRPQAEQKKKEGIFCFFPFTCIKNAPTLDIDEDRLRFVLRTCALVDSTMVLLNRCDEQVGPRVNQMSIIFDAHLT